MSYKDWKTKGEIEKAFEIAKVSDQPISSNEMKEGDFIVQTNGWYGEIVDNRKGNTRVANIHGLFTEAGSIYVWDIAIVCKNGFKYVLKLTEKQEKDQKNISGMMRDIF